jgi:hypothetical protein
MTAQTMDFQVSQELRSDLRKWRSRALPVGIAGAVLSAVGFFISPFQFYRSYLWSYLFILALALGPLAWLLLQYLTGGAWGMVIRRPCEAVLRTMPLVAVMFLPIVIGIPNLYDWAHAAKVAASPVLQHKQPYLNLPFFLIRAAIYFGGWLFLSWHYNRVSLREDTEGHDAVHGTMSTLAGPGLIFWAFTVTFMSIDLVLHHVRPVVYRRPGTHRDGLPHHRNGPAFGLSAHGGSAHAAPPPRSRQIPAGDGDGVGLFLVFAVPDHLGR